MKKLLLLLNTIIFVFIFVSPKIGLALPPALVQDHYRWRNDDGSEVTATWKAPVDTKAFASTNENIRLRFAVNNIMADGNSTLGLQYCVGSTNGPWTDLTATNMSNEFVMSETPNYVNLTPTTDLLPGSGIFISTGKCLESPSNIVEFSSGNSNYVNLEFCFQATTNSTWGSTNFFRLFSVILIEEYPELIIGVPEPAFIILALSVFCFINFKQRRN